LTDFDALFGPHRVMVILRIADVGQAVAAARRVWAAGGELVEVAIGRREQVPALAGVVAAGAELGRLVGAGTVLTVEHVQAAARAGAAYTVAPGLDPDVLTASLTAGLPHLPGVATPSEVHRAWRAGCRWVKAFPASSLGPEWFRALRGPFPGVRYVATGGITVDAAAGYFAAGVRVVAVGADRIDRLGELLDTARGTRLDTAIGIVG
jgi:2-dehydro-3-deoxyphosphogluconate aldolase/(4S)-4-hydroxy-2-oxoglutarate aldolase